MWGGWWWIGGGLVVDRKGVGGGWGEKGTVCRGGEQGCRRQS